MKLAATAVVFALLQGGFDHAGEVDAKPERFRFERALEVPAGAQGQACAVLDAVVYAHADARLNALRVYGGGREVPFAYSKSGEAGQQEEPARLMNLGMMTGGQGQTISFDLAMPRRTYTEVVLDLAGQDFYATAKVWGSDAVGAPRTELGQYPLFDLRSRGLSRSTTLPLQETSFALLHVELKVVAAPGRDAGGDVARFAQTFAPDMVRGAAVPPSREAQTLYTTVAETSAVEQKGRESVATIKVPAHVPVERVSFVIAPEFTRNFSREVQVRARTVSNSTETDAASRESVPAEVVLGNIQRIRLPVNVLGEEIRNEQLSVEAELGASLQGDATVEVAVENGDDAPLPLRAVRLQMRQHRLCFDAEPGTTYTLRYGDDAPVRSPVYDYARLFRPSSTAAVVTMGAEMPMAVSPANTPQRTYLERHPELLWVALLIAIAVLGTVALHNAKRVGSGK